MPTGAGLVDGGGRPRALVAGEGWGGCRGWMAAKKGEGWGLVGCSKEGQVQGRVGLLGSSTGGGKGLVGNPRASVPEGCYFSESWRVDLV